MSGLLALIVQSISLSDRFVDAGSLSGSEADDHAGLSSLRVSRNPHDERALILLELGFLGQQL